MAIELTKQFSINLGAVVNSSIQAVQAVRRSEQSKKEAEFQRAVADGLSYEEQIVLREKQLLDAQSSGFPDADYIAKLEESISNAKRLNRFNTYRTKYAQTLGELAAGKINEEQYRDTLKTMLSSITDPELKLEIENDVAAAEGKVKEYTDTILANQVKKARYDGTSKALKDAIGKVKAARAEASLNDNEDEVTAYDETLSALNSQFSTVKIQDSITEFQVKSSTRGTNPVEKLDYINEQIRNSDGDTAIKIGDRTYESAEQFWQLERDSYLTGSSQIFGNFFKELESETQNKVAVDTAKFGYPTKPTLDGTLETFNDLRSRPEVAPFASKLDITQAVVMTDAVDKFARKVTEVGTNNLTFREGDTQIQNAGNKYGVDVSSYRIDLQNKSLQITDPSENMIPEVNLSLPTVDGKPSPVPPAPSSIDITPVGSSVTPVVTPIGGARVVKAGDTLSRIALESGTTIGELTRLNPELAANPNLIRVGQSIKLPGAPTEQTTDVPVRTNIVPPATGNTSTTTAPTSTVPTAPKPEKPIVPTPPKIQQTPPTAPSTYQGSSIVDYLKSIGKDTSTTARARLAVEKGIVKTEDEYLSAAKTGSNAQFNERLLESLRQ